MSENVESRQLSRTQETFIAAMLTMPTMRKAAQVAQVTEKTAALWLKTPHVLEAYHKARKDAFASSLQGLMDATGEAIETLRAIMANKRTASAVRVRAAQIILDKALEARRQEELEERIQALEEALEGRDRQ